MNDTSLTPQRSNELLEMLRVLAHGAARYYGTGPGASLNRSGRLFVDAGDRLPDDLNRLLLQVIRGANGGQQLFAQGAVFGFLGDDARVLIKAAITEPAAYWQVIAIAADRATAPKLDVDLIRLALSEHGINPDHVDTAKVREVYWA